MNTCHVETLPPLWPHQKRGVKEVLELFDSGADRICVTSPTGGGKTRLAWELMDWGLSRGYESVFYTNRKLLLEQLCRMFDRYGISYGVRASGWDDKFDSGQPIQVAATQTEHRRSFQRSIWKPFPARLVLVDELHLQKGRMAKEIADYHLEYHGSRLVQFTATPLGITDMADHLVVAGTVSECRKTGALVRCEVYGGTEIDTRYVSRLSDEGGEFCLKDIRRNWSHQIFGHVLKSWRLHNPDQRPTVLFAPGVQESVWFAQQFESEGVRAAHIDGSDVYLDGRRRDSTREERESIIEQVRSGDIRVVCNRYVCREGIDLPELYCCILATPIGSLTSYLQTVGRVLRWSPETDHVVLCDHGGNWWRHGSPNIDRDWELVWRMPARTITDLRLERMRERIKGSDGELLEPEPWECWRCGGIRKGGIECPRCGLVSPLKTRRVLQADGQLIHLNGDIFTPRRTVRKKDTQYIWNQCYFRALSAGMTFRAAYGLFYHENKYFPPRDLQYMPTADRELDWFRKAADIDKEELR